MRLTGRRTIAALTATISVAAGPASFASSASVERAVGYLASRQVNNGAFFSASTSADMVAEAAAALSASGGSRAVIDGAMGYVATHGPDRAKDRGGHAARIVLGVRATGADPSTFRGTDFVAALRAHYNEVTGTYDTGVYANALAVLAAASVGIAPSERTLDYFRLSACSNGGMSHEAGCVQAPDVDTTAMAITALRAGGVPADDPVLSEARTYLLKARNADGGWGLESADPTNANSTGLAVSAIIALGEKPTSTPWRAGGSDPVEALIALQLPNGAFSYLVGQRANDYATVQALPAIAGLTYPLKPSKKSAYTWTSTMETKAPRVAIAGAPLAQAGTPEPTPTVDPKESRAARVEADLGDRSSGSGARVLVMWLSLLVAASIIAVPILIRRRRTKP